MTSVLVLLVIAGLAAAAGAVLVHRHALDQPALGVYDGSDLAALAVGIGVTPLLFAVLPVAVASILMCACIGSSSSMLVGRTGSRVRRMLAWVPLALCLGAWRWAGSGATVTMLLDDVALAAMVVAIAVSWAQSGMTTRHLAVVGAGLAVYDIVATTVVGAMAGTLGDLGSMVPAAVFRAPVEGGVAMLGLGDVLAMVLLAAVARRAHGPVAGGLAIAAGLACVLAAHATSRAIGGGVVPVMAFLGPVMVLAHVASRASADRAAPLTSAGHGGSEAGASPARVARVPA